MTDLNELQAIVGDWGNRTFRNATNESITLHLADEVEELGGEAVSLDIGLPGGDRIAEEAADCLMLLLHLAHRNTFSLAAAVERKFAAVQLRTWQTDKNERGYFRHVEPAPPERTEPDEHSNAAPDL